MTETFRFSVKRRAEVVANLEMASPGSNWGETGREAALATISVDRSMPQHVMLYAGEPQHVPIVTHGPFVGETHADLVRVSRAYAEGRMPRVSELGR